MTSSMCNLQRPVSSPSHSFPFRSTGCPKVHHESYGTSAADRLAALLCHPHVCYHRPRLLHGQIPPRLL